MLKVARSLVVIWTIVSGIGVTLNAPAANASCPAVGFTVVEPHATSDTRAVKVGSTQTIYVHRESITTTSDISDIKLALGGENDDDATLQLKFIPAADQRLHDATTNHSGMRIAFLFNNEVMINVVWQGPYGMDLGGSQVSMLHGKDKAQRLMKAIRGCTAPAVGNRTP